MIICEWRAFSTDTETYTQALFENLMEDKFEAMMLKDNDPIPSYIWTKNYVIHIRKNSKILTDISFEKVPRNPDCVNA
ncbi:hypothetical protein [Robertmurraya massiliosenegalensis]|uniref:hypothetical protein n=1 Tax=Robertmurraya massiliosenegalensis TaxID=1287657 RepID=UPI000318C376|nr:hypothetical protein [Robertmurraya massiliosenegalensis]